MLQKLTSIKTVLMQAKEPKSNFNDPARHKPGVLSGFLKSVTKAGGEGGCELLTHFAAWQQRIAKERRLRAFSCPPAPRTPLAPGTDTAAAAEAVWALVRATRSQHRYEDAYSFKSYLPGWRRVRRRIVLPADAAGSTVGSTHEVLDSDGEGGEGSAGVRPRLLAVDCEMCETEGDKKALLGVCVVDEEGQVLFKVRWPHCNPAGIARLHSAYRTHAERHIDGMSCAGVGGSWVEPCHPALPTTVCPEWPGDCPGTAPIHYPHTPVSELSTAAAVHDTGTSALLLRLTLCCPFHTFSHTHRRWSDQRAVCWTTGQTSRV